MANLHIVEFSGLGATDPSDSLPIFSPDALLATQSIVSSSTSTPSVAFQPTTRFVKLTAGGPMAIAFGPVASVAAVAGGWFLASGETILVRVRPNVSPYPGAAAGTNGVAIITEPTP